MKLTGFSDEAGAAIEAQIEATKRLGWKYLDIRTIESTPLWEVPMDLVERFAARLKEEGLSVTCAASSIANHGRSIDEPMDEDHREIDALLPRMKTLGIPAVRIMSYAPRRNDWFTEDQNVDERIERMRLIVDRFTSENIEVQHENCFNYGGRGWRETLELVDALPGLKLAFDTGNPAITPKIPACPSGKAQDPLAFFQHVKQHVVAVHIKDPVYHGERPESIWPKSDYMFPGLGEACIPDIVAELVADGYTGTIAIEPHMRAPNIEGVSDEEARIRQYVEYGRRFEDILKSASAIR